VFQDEAFRTRHCLGSVNSVNALRLLVQVVHFFYSYFQVTAEHQPLHQPLNQPLKKPLERPLPKVSFAIPTGAAGHVTAGLIAKLMGLPIDKLVMAVNANDVLHTMMTDGVLAKGADVHHTASPAMDIQVGLCSIYMLSPHKHDMRTSFACILYTQRVINPVLTLAVTTVGVCDDLCVICVHAPCIYTMPYTTWSWQAPYK
jgi:threonine synthase